MPLFRGGITERLVWMAGISFFRQAAPPFSPRGAAPTIPGAEDEEAELSTATTLTKYRVPQGMNRRRTNEEEEENRTLKYSIKQHGGKHQYSACLSKPTPCNVNLTQRKIFDKPFPFTNNQTTHRVGHVSSGSNSCISESSPGWKGLPLYQKLGDNYTRPLGPQLRKGLHNKPTEKASPTCPSQGAKLLKRGNSEPLQEVQNMVEKNTISRVCKEQEGFRSQLFMVPKKDGSKDPSST